MCACPTGPGCSETHVPGYISSEKTLKAGDVYVVSVNDAFVMKAWGKQLDPEKKSKVRLFFFALFPLTSFYTCASGDMHTNAHTQIRFLADPTGAFTKDPL